MDSESIDSVDDLSTPAECSCAKYVHSTYAVDDALSAAIVNNERRAVSRHKYWPPLLPSRQPSPFVPHSLLYSGAHYVGNQKHKGNSSDVEVFIHSVDEAAHTLCGYLIIRGLNDQNPVLETFFTGEIISDRHPFLTRKWEADQDVDKKHWGKFGAFAHFARDFNADDFDYARLADCDTVFMRWKEQFVVSIGESGDATRTNHDLSGASIAGFYYIALQKATGQIDGYYFQKSIEWYQSVTLSHQPERTMQFYEFR